MLLQRPASGTSRGQDNKKRPGLNRLRDAQNICGFTRQIVDTSVLQMDSGAGSGSQPEQFPLTRRRTIRQLFQALLCESRHRLPTLPPATPLPAMLGKLPVFARTYGSTRPGTLATEALARLPHNRNTIRFFRRGER